MRPNCFSHYFRWLPDLVQLSTNVQIVGLAAVCWAIWKFRNDASFEHKLIKDPAELICRACAFLNYWAELQKDGNREVLLAGASNLQAKALDLRDGANGSKRRLQIEEA
ncbi:hypothetical protein BRADI_3g42776v3 [Brachypodium distachyon]|uniref:Uncharacterized protein n=1 Tax=Brachypodium distachyon TaxID=15368 RepID=A0A0Q3FJC0_BRADI|nr:hypothetical protein BRADI_3g42776v3 [Brachypodium distachyon]